MPTSAADPTATRMEEEALRLARHGSLPAAATVCRALNTRYPQFASGWCTASFVALEMKDAAGALNSIERALGLVPADARFLLQKAHALRGLGRAPEALEIAKGIQPTLTADAGSLDSLGTLYSSCGEQELALAAYDRAIQLAPRIAAFKFNRAAVRRFLGQIAAAETDYDQVIAARPDDFEAYLNRSALRKQTRERNHVAELERALTRAAREWRSEVQIRYALAKEYEDLGEYERSWAHLDKGARLRRRYLKYDIERDVETVDWIIEAFPNVFAPAACDASGRAMGHPIFIVGLPRSGSTLAERILASHSAVHSAGELTDFAHALVTAATAKGTKRPMPRQELVAASAKIDFAALGRDYLQRTRPVAGNTAYFIDKMPLNYLYCGIIRRALPNARIVHLTRHPLAVCYAMYKTLFDEGYPFSYDLNEIGRYYLSYRKLMDHWHATVPGAIHDLSYEQLVADPEGEIGRLLEFCGLPWEDACLDFHRNAAPSTTASATQVRQPIYDSSVAQWQHYASHLEGLRSQLVAAGIAVAG
jgi:tetratricopeptide (TPR) repeat protein